MIRPTLLWRQGGEARLAEVPSPLPLDDLVPGAGAWEVELGFGKGRYLLARAEEALAPGGGGERFLGVEMASKYYRIAAGRAARRGLGNLLLLRGEVLYLLATALPRSFAAAVHVYFPDPWPKSRHHKRRLFDAETVDLVLGLLVPGGRLLFATDHLDYGEETAEILAGCPDLALRRLAGPWPGGPRTNYEAKYAAEGRPILRLEGRLEAVSGPLPLHPRGRTGVVAAV